MNTIVPTLQALPNIEFVYTNVHLTPKGLALAIFKNGDISSFETRKQRLKHGVEINFVWDDTHVLFKRYIEF